MPDLAATAALVGSQAAALAALAATSYVLGRLLTRALPLAPGVERAAVACTVGLAGLADLALFLGLLGHLTRPALAAALATIHLIGLVGLRIDLRPWRDLAADVRTALPRRP